MWAVASAFSKSDQAEQVCVVWARRKTRPGLLQKAQRYLQTTTWPRKCPPKWSMWRMLVKIPRKGAGTIWAELKRIARNRIPWRGVVAAIMFPKELGCIMSEWYGSECWVIYLRDFKRETCPMCEYSEWGEQIWVNEVVLSENRDNKSLFSQSESNRGNHWDAL